MTSPAPRTAPGSVGVVDTRFLDLPAPLRLECGRTLPAVRVAYETYGTLSPARDNVLLVCHALSGDAHAAGYARQVKFAACGAPFSASRAARSASTLTPLLTLVAIA